MGSPVRPDAFDEWYATVAPGVTNRISAMVADPVVGRELAAEAFARAYERWGRVRRMKSPEGWVFQTARNLHRSTWRRKGIERRALAKLSGSEVMVSHAPHDEDSFFEIGGADAAALNACLAELPERMQRALRLRYWEQLTEAQVADEMAVSVGTVSATLSQGRARLRLALNKHESLEPTLADGRTPSGPVRKKETS